jgi:hypothetical protein
VTPTSSSGGPTANCAATPAGLLFGVILWAWQGGDVARTYYAGYLIEKALSIDNVFVFALIFSYFAVPASLQHKVLFWGVVGALVFRLVFIFVGAELLEAFFWTAYVFGAFLIYTGYKMAFRHDEQTPPDRNPVVRLVRTVVPTDANYHGDSFFTRMNGKHPRAAQPVLLPRRTAAPLRAPALRPGRAVRLRRRQTHPVRDSDRQAAHPRHARRDRGHDRGVDHVEPAQHP